MTWFLNRHSHSPVAAALRAAMDESVNHGAAVGMWVVWLRSGRALACDWCPRLDIEAPVAICADADTAVVVAIAPQRLAHPVTSRAQVAGEYLETKGFRVEVVHVRALHEGALWISLRGGVGGVVPAQRISARCPRLLFPGAALMSSRSAAAACVLLAAMLFAAPAPAAPPPGQPGLITTPNSGGQAGVTAPPRALAPAAPADSVDDQPARTVVPAESASYPQTAQAISASPQPSVPHAPGRTASPSSGGGATAFGQDIAAVSDVVRFGSAELRRPDWMPASIADRERDWNAFLAARVAAAADQAGLTNPAVDAALGTGGDEQAPLPQELVLAQMVAADPTTLVPAITHETDAVISAADAEVPDLAAPVADVLGALATAQPPA
ncbi:hypothetical protein GPX89_07610 [Nocardia sp. ET3-3]|uniref:Uncharacterized protein n=1 Tax=Nocardia terrae TaxID=2675851 RepID=A0A7K1URY1_9NOCA|nr:hypothetical protein [Nocardia terrae]MVU77113.1 hypothetical protein [Nocardia terrae]